MNHDSKGQFIAGNKAAEKTVTMGMKRVRQLIRDVTTVKEVYDIWTVVKASALLGEQWAVKMFMEYMAGKPEDMELQERLERLEDRLDQRAEQRLVA